jgi:hypothetical protein
LSALAWFGAGAAAAIVGMYLLRWVSEVIAFRSWWGP